MARIRRPKRGRVRSKRLDLTDLRHAMKDHRLWNVMAVVVVPDGESSHFELVEEDGKIVDILVEVETCPEQLDLTCRLGTGAGGPGRGIWSIPSVGTEVIVNIPDGMIEFMPTIVAELSSGDIPNPTDQGPTTTRTIITDAEVLVHDGSGGAEPLVRKSEHDALKAVFDDHRHYQFGYGGSPAAPDSGALIVTSPPQTGAAGTAAPGKPIEAVEFADITGTEVFKAR